MNNPSARMRRLGAGAIAALALALLPTNASAVTTISCSGTPVVLCIGHTTETSGLHLDANFRIEVPANWNKTLVLYSHGYDSFTTPNPATDAPDDVTGAWLLSQGYALAGSAYARAGWSAEQAFQDQIAVLDLFTTTFRHPDRTIAWGHSLGGMITAGLVQLFPDRFQGAIPMCGVLEGSVAVWNEALDGLFSFATLQAPGAFNYYNLSPATAYGEYLKAKTAFATANSTAAGRAHIALAAALNNIPGWYDPTKPEPAANDWAAREANQYAWISGINLLFGFLGRAELESRAGGLYSWNTGVNYKTQLAHSTGKAEVQALYAAAGLDLEEDLGTLNETTRITANPQAVANVAKVITFNGELEMPVLTMHTTGDGLVEPTAEQAYKSVVRSAGNGQLLRQVFVHRAGHCTFTPAETIAAFTTLQHRLNTGQWGNTSATAMNSRAAGLALGLATFIDFAPTRFLRPFTTDDAGDNQGGPNN
jgi:pimeloyl-ACP methyl ester carboxylesterase